LENFDERILVKEKKALQNVNLIIIIGYIRQSIEILLSLKDEGNSDSNHGRSSIKGKKLTFFNFLRVKNSFLKEPC
jgi:hypothetical protein